MWLLWVWLFVPAGISAEAGASTGSSDQIQKCMYACDCVGMYVHAYVCDCVLSTMYLLDERVLCVCRVPCLKTEK